MKKCIICGNSLRGRQRKYCSDKCRHEGWKRYLRKRYAEKVLKEKKEYLEKKEQQNRDFARYTKVNHRKFESRKKHPSIQWTEEMSKKMKELVEQQQFIPKYRKKDYCEVCGISKKEYPDVILYKHHVKYSPRKIVTLCSSCHAFLHHALLKKRKCRNY